jgi:hypothetical protein
MNDELEEFEKEERTFLEARKEAKRIKKLFHEVFKNEEAEEALDILRKYFEVENPSAPVANFDTKKMLYLDGHKAVFKEIEDIIEGKYDE